ncbi:MAG TPA: SMC-Scp complex subunit ScpB [Pseudothermotoga sp.]|uniref:SMC-Scp complex subunit ScpB n=1 Tax=Thermotoga profunda TaxID=1508420 RepID=UPI00069324C8|nr:SMC-Scp complex subunit ScpB [Thermotoga profunda]
MTLNLKAVVEALIFAARGMTLERLVKITESDAETITKVLDDLVKEYNNEDHGVELKKVGDVYRFYTKPEYSTVISKVVRTFYTKLSSSQMEIVAAILLNGPSTIQTLNELRGKDSSAIVRSLHKSGVLTRKKQSNTYVYQLNESFRDFLMIEGVLDQATEHSGFVKPSSLTSES